MFFPCNWEFGSALAKLWNFRGGLNPHTSPLWYATGWEQTTVGNLDLDGKVILKFS
jgi:hypothetical protein